METDNKIEGLGTIDKVSDLDVNKEDWISMDRNQTAFYSKAVLDNSI